MANWLHTFTFTSFPSPRNGIKETFLGSTNQQRQREQKSRTKQTNEQTDNLEAGKQGMSGKENLMDLRVQILKPAKEKAGD